MTVDVLRTKMNKKAPANHAFSIYSRREPGYPKSSIQLVIQYNPITSLLFVRDHT